MKNPFGMTVRTCRESDYRFVYELTKKTLWPYISVFVTPDPNVFKQRFFSQYPRIKILMKGKRRIGFYLYTLHQTHLDINKVFLSPAYHKRGIGNFLMDYLEGKAHTCALLSVWKNNPAVSFYKKRGYRIIEKSGYKYIMRKDLS